MRRTQPGTLDRQRTERKHTKRNKNEMWCCVWATHTLSLIHHFHCPFNANLLFMIFQPFSFRNGESSSPNAVVSMSTMPVFVIISSDAISLQFQCELWKQNMCRNHFTSYKVAWQIFLIFSVADGLGRFSIRRDSELAGRWVRATGTQLFSRHKTLRMHTMSIFLYSVRPSTYLSPFVPYFVAAAWCWRAANFHDMAKPTNV